MPGSIHILKPRPRSDRERLADVLGRRWLTVIERGARDGDMRSRPKWIEEAAERAMESVNGH